MNVAEAVRSSLLAYCSLTNPNYKTPKHLITIAKILESVERGQEKRVIITIPPRHGKSMLCSTYFPAWYLGKNSNKQIITATYGQDLSDDFGRKIRDQFQSPEFSAVFTECVLDKRTQAANRLNTMSGGSYYGVGAGGPITGRGADLLLIDDPIKNREEADSETMREKLYSWYSSVAYTRLMPGGAIVLIMTRWHEDDLIGRILKNHSHENWKIVNLKAVQDDGCPLWPEAYDLAALANIQKTLGDYDWSCLYQQDPIPASGIIVKPEWMQAQRLCKEYSAIMIGIDPAIGLKEHNDETAICVGGIGFGLNPGIDELETIYGHWTMDEICALVEGLVEKYNADFVGIEDVQAQAWLVQALVKRGIKAAPIKTGGKDKVVRLLGISHFMTQGRVSIRTPKLRAQLLKFRGGNEDNDLVDAFVYMMILMRDYTRERVKAIEKYKDLTPHQAWFRESEDKLREREFGKVQQTGAWGDGLPSDTW